LNEKTHFEKLALKSELKALRAQMNPHFMFNVLNTIKGIVLNNKPLDAAEHLSDFSYLLRQSLQQSREPLISLKDDLETVQLYVRLERLRFAEKFDFECLIHDDVPLDDIQLPPMLLQPYIENAIVHAFNGLKEKGKLLLEIKLDGDSVCCIIDDNGIGRTKKSTQASTKKHQSLGMKITNERIEMQNQLNDLGLEVQILDKKNAEGKAEGTRVVLRIPII
jgi:LytS/YehU family sensor histidine kinase